MPFEALAFVRLRPNNVSTVSATDETSDGGWTVRTDRVKEDEERGGLGRDALSPMIEKVRSIPQLRESNDAN